MSVMAMFRQPSCRETANFLTFIDLTHPQS